MRRLILIAFLAAVVGGLVVVDLGARRFAERRVADVVARQVGTGGMASVTIRAFPFLPPLLVGGRVAHIEVSQADVPAGPLRLDHVTLDVTNVVLARDRLFRGQAVVERIGGGTVRATVSETSLAAAAHLPVQLHTGRATATVAAHSVSLGIAVVGGQLAVTAAGSAAVHVAVPVLPLLPCVSSVKILEGAAELSCHIDTVPAALVRGATVG